MGYINQDLMRQFDQLTLEKIKANSDNHDIDTASRPAPRAWVALDQAAAAQAQQSAFEAWAVRQGKSKAELLREALNPRQTFSQRAASMLSSAVEAMANRFKAASQENTFGDDAIRKSDSMDFRSSF
jgi:tetrahydrodipicolinate N-succinyltransferase